MLRYKSGELILDWGAGCAHGLAHIIEKHKVLAFAADALSKNMDWALQRLPILMATAYTDFVQLFRMMEEGALDHIMTNSVLMYLKRRHQCDFLQEAIRVLRPGGTLWLGYNVERQFSISKDGFSTTTGKLFWRQCIQKTVKVHFHWISSEMDIFGLPEWPGDFNATSQIFSVFVVKAW